MTKEEKKNVIIALALCVAAVIIIWLLGRGSPISYGDYTGVQFNPADIPGGGTNYTNYNIPPSASPNVGSINVGGNTTNTGNDCCGTPCGNPSSPGNAGYWLYRQLAL